MTEEINGYLKGHLLMAIPGLPDPNFAQTVTCLCEHNEAGALGFIINRIHPLLTGRELFDDLNIECTDSIDKVSIFLGGPVQPSGVFVLHGQPFDWHSCMKVTEDIGLSNTREILEAIARGEGPDSFLILLGCAGWGPLQLDSELSDNAWMHCPASRKIVFETRTDQIWEQTMMNIGLNSDNFSDAAGSD